MNYYFLATEGTENTEKEKFEIRSTKSETISKPECSNGRNEKESRIAQIQRILATKTRRGKEAGHGLTQINADLGQRENEWMGG